MKCQQCLSRRGELAEYRVFSDIINVEVCLKCAEKAREFGLKTTSLNEGSDQQENDLEHAA
jgi:hypothetical protein